MLAELQSLCAGWGVRFLVTCATCKKGVAILCWMVHLDRNCSLLSLLMRGWRKQLSSQFCFNERIVAIMGPVMINSQICVVVLRHACPDAGAFYYVRLLIFGVQIVRVSATTG